MWGNLPLVTAPTSEKALILLLAAILYRESEGSVQEALRRARLLWMAYEG
jgi:hypothetical protein